MPVQRQPGRSSDVAGMPSSVNDIHGIIRNEIITLQLMPGAKVSENELARRFHTSRTPVREALLRLVDEGLVEVWPQRGTLITPISLRAVWRARFVREAIEVAVFRKAASDGLPADVLAKLDGIIREQREAGEDPVRFTEADDAFHQAFADGIAVGDIWAVLEREKAQFDRLRFLSLPNVTPVTVLIDQHERMIAAVRARDPEAAEKAVRNHLSEVLKVTEQLSARYPGLIINDI
ncbi:GntR family transcriptional regulator [Sinorhizobium sp. RAC02]|uniref:GntR family transcriptional regulator n=1 Tax=Sinorhizobium sp. RAC02 TaxID=1842534 RepID=UPI0008580761|nr:GntR family transcriptional regulator [Sinorhizobium sp. RAC02]AOF92443.1 bacterial regulatory s, gntR family protein [Sinorhizobium sp. RAC02]